jgi:hypothetical protein
VATFLRGRFFRKQRRFFLPGVVSNLWTPANLTVGPHAWYDAQTWGTITQSGGAVSQWDDRSGNARHVAQYTGAPAYSPTSFNGLPGLSFSNHSLLNTSFGFTGTAEIAAFAAIQIDTGIANNDRALSLARGTVGGDLDYDNTASVALLRVGSSLTTISTLTTATTLTTVPFTNAVPLIVGTAHTSGVSDMWKNGTAGSTLATEPTLAFDSGRFAIGSNASDGLETFTGVLGEVIVLSYRPTTTERQKIEGYLAWRWGLEAELPVGHPYESAAPTVGGADASGSTITVTASVVAGTATGAATAAGSTITVTTSMVAGSATASVDGTATGSTPTATASLVAGTATGAATAAGSTITLTASMVAGSAEGGTAASRREYIVGPPYLNETGSRQYITASYYIIEAVTAAGVDDTASGSTITVTASLVAGTATGAATAAGSTITVTASLVAGTAVGGTATPTREYIVGPPYLNETGDRQYIVNGYYITETATVAEVETPATVKRGGSYAPQSDHRRSKRTQDPRSAIERLIARFRAAQAALKGEPEATPPPVKTAVTAARRAPEGDLLAPFATALAVEWDAVVADMAARDADMQAITARALEILEAIEQAQDEDDEEVMLLLAA